MNDFIPILDYVAKYYLNNSRLFKFKQIHACNSANDCIIKADL